MASHRVLMLAALAAAAPSALAVRRADVEDQLSMVEVDAEEGLDAGSEAKIIPFAYPGGDLSNAPKELNEPMRKLVGQRLARCYEPKADGQYTGEEWKDALDAYMKKQVKRGLRKTSKVVIYEMPHVWGQHWFTKYLPHHWIASVVSDVDAAPSAYCMNFDYDAPNLTDVDDPNGCSFFKNSFKPTKALTQCLTKAMDKSLSWKARGYVMGAKKMDKGKFVISMVEDGDRFVHKLTAHEARYNGNANIVRELVNEESECGLKQGFWSVTCSDGSKPFRIRKNCGLLGLGEKADLICEKRSKGGDQALAALLRGQPLELVGELCPKPAAGDAEDEETNVPKAEEGPAPLDLDGKVAVIEGGGNCSSAEKVAAAVRRGAMAVILRVLPGQHYYKASATIGKGEAIPVPTFSVDDSKFAQYLERSSALRVDAFEPQTSAGEEQIPNFWEEVDIWQSRDDVGWLNTRDRVYEMIKKVSMEDLPRNSVHRARHQVARAARVSMTQPTTSKYDSIDAETEEAILQCYGLGLPEGEAQAEAKQCKALKVLSAGERMEFGKREEANLAQFWLGGEKVEFETTRGINVVMVDPSTQEVISKTTYDTSKDKTAAKKMQEDFAAAARGTIVMAAVKSRGLKDLAEEGVSALASAGAERAAKGRLGEGYAFIGVLGGRRLAEKIGRWTFAESAIPCDGEGSTPTYESALVGHEASKCLAVMWDKSEVGGPPFPQVSEASGSFPGDNLEVIDSLNVHPVCSRMSVALNSFEMSDAPYPNPDEWEPGDKFQFYTGMDAMNKGNPRWVAAHMLDFCLNPDTAVCTSYSVCWAMLTRHVTKLIHPWCSEKARAFPEMPIIEQGE